MRTMVKTCSEHSQKIILNHIWETVNGNLNFKTDLTHQDDNMDGIIVGLNILSQQMLDRVSDLEMKNRRQEQQIRELESYIHSNLQIENFKYLAAHDVQEPLRNIISFSQLLEKRFEPTLGHTGKEYLNYVIGAGKQLKSLMQGLLKYVSIDRASPHIFTDLTGIVQDVLLDYEDEIIDYDFHIAVEHLPKLSVNPKQIRLLFDCLIQNAIQARKSEDNLLTIDAKLIGDQWLFTVEDNGMGFENLHSERIFAVFEKLKDRDNKQIGMGLAIAKRIVELHGGSIWAESKPNKGATFQFTIPI